MHKLASAVAMAAALLFAGLVSWKAEATTSVGPSGLPGAVKGYSLIDKAAVADTASIAHRDISGLVVGVDAGALAASAAALQNARAAGGLRIALLL